MQTLQNSSDLISRGYGLIGSDRVEGTPVFALNGEPLGRIERVMIDKLSGTVAYAVMSIEEMAGEDPVHYPVPWPMLAYNTEFGGYAIDLSEDGFENAPSFASEDDWEYESREQEDQLYKYYNTPPYWVVKPQG